MKYLVLAMLLTFISPLCSYAADWPQWQGPDRNAVSNDKGLLQAWPKEGPPLAWRVNGLGGGDSAPAVADGKIFGMSNRDGKEIVWALSEANGKELWVTPLGDAVEQRMPQSKEGPGGTPTVDGDRLFVIGMGGTVACLSVADGKVVWQKSLTEDFGGVVPTWSYRESPLVDGENVICTPGSSDAMLVALNKNSGETIWKASVPNDSTADTPASETPRRRENSTRADRPTRSNENTASTPSIAGTKDANLFISEHWGMTEFSKKVPNGKYLAKLYFAETFQGITDKGQRVFSFNVQGKEFKDFDIWEKAGGPRRAYIESVPVEVNDGELRITFSRQVENPAIKAIEIVPQSASTADAKTIRINAGASSDFTDSRGNVWQSDEGFKDGSVNPGTLAFAAGGRGSGRFSGRRRGPRSGAAYSSVIAIDFEGGRQYVQLTANALIGVSASNGELLWKYDRPANRMGINCSTPIYEDGLVFAASAYGNGGGAVKLVKSDDGEIKADEVYFTPRMQNHHGGMIVVDGCLYGANGGNGGGFLTCLDYQTGEVLWRDRDAPKGSLLFADGRLYLRSEEDELLLIEPSRDGLVERGCFKQPDRSESPAWAHPVVANGKLYVRDQDFLLCYDVKAK